MMARRRQRLVKVMPLTSFAFGHGASLTPGRVADLPKDLADAICDGIRARKATDDEVNRGDVMAAEQRARHAEERAARLEGQLAEAEARVAELEAAAEDGDGTSEDEVASALLGAVPTGTVDDVMAFVRGAPIGDDPTEGHVDRARAALVVEFARPEGEQRSSLIDPLERLVLEADEGDDDDGSDDDADDDGGDDDAS